MSNQLNFEDLKVGQSWASNGRTITQADIVAFATTTGDFNPLHVDAEFAKKTPFGEVVAHGLLGIAWAAGLSSQRPSVNTKAFLGIRDWQFKMPLKCGDTIHVETIVLEPEPRGKNKGRVLWELKVVNQSQEIVQIGKFETIVVATVGKAAETSTIPSPHLISTAKRAES